MGERKQKEVALDFRDNPRAWLSAGSKFSFLLVRLGELSYKEQTLSVDGTNLLCVVVDRANKAVERESDGEE